MGRAKGTRGAILDVVVDVLLEEGYDAIHLQAVAKRARVSLATIYQFFPTRDELILAGISRWVTVNGYSHLADPPPPHESLQDGLMWVLRQVFAPWERSPRMLEAFHRARSTPAGHALDTRGSLNTKRSMASLLANLDPTYADDLVDILVNLAENIVARAVHGTLPIEEMVPTVERAVFRLTSDNAALARRFAPAADDVAQ